MYRGETMAGIIADEARHDTSRGFVGRLLHGDALARACRSWPRSLDPGAWGREFTAILDAYENTAGMWLVGEDMPQETNRVTLQPRR